MYPPSTPTSPHYTFAWLCAFIQQHNTAPPVMYLLNLKLIAPMSHTFILKFTNLTCVLCGPFRALICLTLQSYWCLCVNYVKYIRTLLEYVK